MEAPRAPGGLACPSRLGRVRAAPNPFAAKLEYPATKGGEPACGSAPPSFYEDTSAPGARLAARGVRSPSKGLIAMHETDVGRAWPFLQLRTGRPGSNPC